MPTALAGLRSWPGQLCHQPPPPTQGLCLSRPHPTGVQGSLFPSSPRHPYHSTAILDSDLGATGHLPSGLRLAPPWKGPARHHLGPKQGAQPGLLKEGPQEEEGKVWRGHVSSPTLSSPLEALLLGWKVHTRPGQLWPPVRARVSCDGARPPTKGVAAPSSVRGHTECHGKGPSGSPRPPAPNGGLQRTHTWAPTASGAPQPVSKEDMEGRKGSLGWTRGTHTLCAWRGHR